MKNRIYITALTLSLLTPMAGYAFDQSSPPDSLIVDTTGNVGVGTASPQAKLDVRGKIESSFNGENPTGLLELMTLKATNTTPGQFSDAGIVLENAGTSGFKWSFRTLENTGGFAASKQGTGGKEFEVRNPTGVAANTELHLANGASNVGGQWLNASSRSYKKDIVDLSREDAMATLNGLNSVTYKFKRDEDNTQRVGFIAEDVPALIATKDKKTVDSLQIISVLTKVAKIQNKAIEKQQRSLLETQSQMKAKDEKIAAMESKLEKLIMMQEKMAKSMEARLIPFTTVSYNTSIK